MHRCISNLVRPTLIYISCEAVIPAPYQVRGRLIKAGMTIKVKGFLTQYISYW